MKKETSPTHRATPTDALNVDKISVICYKIYQSTDILS